MVEIHDTHEQSEIVKGWLRENGGAIVLGLVLAFGSLFGFKQWQLWEQNQYQRASAEYEMLVSMLTAGNLDGAVANYETLKAEYSKSAYTSLAALRLAKARLEVDQPDLAVQLLEYAMNNGVPQAVQLISRERLARVKLDQGESGAALQLINDAPSDVGFEPQFAEIKGDISRLQGDFSAAADYYSEALDALEEGTGNRAFLEIKLESVGAQGDERGQAL
jgi:predicted negative regulator of RcsB-dependent stress response